MRTVRGIVVRMLARTGVLPDVLELRHRERTRCQSILAAARTIQARRRVADLDVRTHRWVDTGSNRLLCRIEPTATADRAMLDNLLLVVDVVEAAGIPLFFVPLPGLDHFGIGVPIEHRHNVWRAFLESNLPPETSIEPINSPFRSAHPAARRDFARIGPRLLKSNMWKVCRPVTDPTGSAVFGDRYSCQIEFWSPQTVTATRTDVEAGERSLGSDDSTVLTAPRRNSVAGAIPRSSLSEATIDLGGRAIPAPTAFAKAHSAASNWFPIDVVYTWVNDTDPAWIERLEAARTRAGLPDTDAMSSCRFTNRDELRYSLRSLHQFADFVRHVYVVTDQQTPRWLDTESPGLTIVDHREIFEQDGVLPTFNSHAIEACLHKIEGLADHYLYLNDDVFFGRRVVPSNFFVQSGLSKYFLSSARIPLVASELSVDSAARNGQELMWQEFGLYPTQKFKHTPHPQRRDVMLEIERRFPDAVKTARNSAFRSPTDISAASSLHHHVGAALGRAVAGQLRYDYVQLSSENLAGRLRSVTDGSWHSFCLNDVAPDSANQPQIDQILRHMLERAFPWPSPWELRSEIPGVDSPR